MSNFFRRGRRRSNRRNRRNFRRRGNVSRKLRSSRSHDRYSMSRGGIRM